MKWFFPEKESPEQRRHQNNKDGENLCGRPDRNIQLYTFSSVKHFIKNNSISSTTKIVKDASVVIAERTKFLQTCFVIRLCVEKSYIGTW